MLYRKFKSATMGQKLSGLISSCSAANCCAVTDNLTHVLRQSELLQRAETAPSSESQRILMQILNSTFLFWNSDTFSGLIPVITRSHFGTVFLAIFPTICYSPGHLHVKSLSSHVFIHSDSIPMGSWDETRPTFFKSVFYQFKINGSIT